MRIPATIAAIRGETPSVKSFMLDLGGRPLGFSAGQWVDFFITIEGAEAVGGYSITSSPAVQTAISLAVKRDDDGAHPVTAWLHDEARAGDRVEIALGGDFHFAPGESDSVTLIGGGIGLTPLMSVLRAVDELSPATRLALLYSATAPSELLFRRELESIAARNPRIRCEFTITRPTSEIWRGRTGRVTAAMMREAEIETDSLCFICGPPAMIEDMAAALIEIGVPRSRIRYERWW